MQIIKHSTQIDAHTRLPAFFRITRKAKMNRRGQSASIFVSGLFKSATVDYECILHLVGAMWMIKLSHLLKYMTHSENNDRNMIRHNKKDVKVLQSSSVDSLRAQQSTTNAFYISLELCG